MDGRIIETVRLNFECNRCDEPAVLKVRTQYTNAMTERIHFFCAKHIPTRILDEYLHRVKRVEIPK